MRAVLTKAWSEVRRRRLQSAVIVVMVALASGTITLGLNLLLESRSPTITPSRRRTAPTSRSSTTPAR